MSAETPVDSTLPLIEAAALEAGVPGALLLGRDLEARGYFAEGIVAQWRLAAAVLWEHLAGAPGAAEAVGRLAAHREPRVRFLVPGILAAQHAEDPDRGLARLRDLAEDQDFRVAEAVQAFGVRPFAEREGAAVVERLMAWVRDPSPMVRRAAVQAVRPRGFWVRRLEWAHASPGLLLPLLESLRGESDRYPANAVANCFNDISRQHPALALAVLQRWVDEGGGPQVEHIARKALRSLIKDGDPRALRLFGLQELPLSVEAELLGGPEVRPNSALVFVLRVHNRGADATAQLVYELQTTGRIAGRPRRKRYQGGAHLLHGGATSEIVLRERIFDRKAARLIDGPGAALFWLNGVQVAELDFAVRRADQPSQG